ncbi:MAG: C4-dicarboxylate ABC transporter substrate-binding protein, partial [Lachnospiraceae bacterium]|nr:C4-dicarboxylate ABC transporter substrate-binding protein [Lachnospiraceae bacterium]
EFNRQISEEAENKEREEVTADGDNTVPVDDVTPWQEAVKSVITENTKGQEDLYQQILDLAK